MRQLTDSSDVVADAAALRRRLAEDGYLYLPGLLPGDDVLDVRRGVAAALADVRWLAPGATSERPVPSGRAVREGADGYLSAYERVQRLQRFHELAHSGALVDVVRRIVDAPLLVHPRKIARTSLPHDGEYTRPHQDFRLIQGSVDTFTVWVPLGACPRVLGGLRVLTGSHRRGLAPADPAGGPGGLAVDVPDDDPAWATADYAAGDVLVFTSLTVHAAMRNDSDELRMSADFRYQSLREPVVAGSLLPHFHPQIPHWDELTSGWTSRDAVAAPDEVVLVEPLPPLDPSLHAPPSTLLSVA